MRYLSRALLAVFTAVVLLAGLGSTALAAETAGSELVIISENEVVNDDLYAAGVRVIVDGKLDGDLIAFAAEDVLIRGEVTGDVYAVASRVRVEGQVGGSLRVSSSSLELLGTVERDLVTTSFSVDLMSDSHVGGDVVAWAFNMTAAGTIGGNLTATVRSLDLEGTVAHDVDVTLRQLTITGPLSVGGDLGYRSEREAEGLEEASVGGAVVKKTPTPPNIRVRALNMLTRILIALFLTATAMLVAWGWPERTERAAEKTISSPFRAFGWGAMVVLSPLIVAAAVGLMVGLGPSAVSVPLLVIFAPVVLAMGGIVLALSLIAGVPTVFLLGRRLPGDRGMYGAVALGSAVVAILWLIPLVSWIVPLLVLPLGMGGWILSRGSLEAEEKAEN